MIFDLEGDLPADVNFDICILGAGPAGISIAQKFQSSTTKVLLLEAGGMNYTEQSSQFLKCKSTGLEAWPQWSRQRYFGGSSNHWTGRCRPFESHDFFEKDFNGLPGWPIRYSDVENYLDEAKVIVDIDQKEFGSISDEVLGDQFVPDEFAISPPTRFGDKYFDIINSSSNITCYLNANAVELELDQGLKKVETVVVRNYSSKGFRFKATTFVVAMGGIENARFLLNQNKQIKSGIGNQTGMVGKCFMEHLNVKLGEFIAEDSEQENHYQFYTTPVFVKKSSIGSANVRLHQTNKIRSFGRTARIKSFFKTLACDLSVEDKIQFITEFDCPGTGIITTLIEQEPSIRSYIALDKEVDALGLRHAILHWELTMSDYLTIRTIAHELAVGFANADLGLVKLEGYILDPNLEILVSRHAHHMGTTRMAALPEHGVVDTDCKVFGTRNLYIAGSSIFATGGACNPTMPLVQFALRLADHIEKSVINDNA